jgi:tRNA and rRNA cytosine-C5-methylases
MHIPSVCIAWWQEALGAEEAQRLCAALLESPAPVSLRRHPKKPWGHLVEGLFSATVPWCETGRYLSERPVFTLDPCFHAGGYYVQEAASMFVVQLAPLIQTEGLRRVLDLCAAPGGKASLLAEMLPSDGILIANEPIAARAAVLGENMSKWGYAQVGVSSKDAGDFARLLPQYFDLILVDAPCSGEGMFRKDPAAVTEWSPEGVELCAQRQRRIVGEAWAALRPGGYLAYSTCTFNRRENEDNVAWMRRELGAQSLNLPLAEAWGVRESEGGYRFLPQYSSGEGFFFALLQKPDGTSLGPGGPSQKLHLPRPVLASVPKTALPYTWIEEGYSLWMKGDLYKALPLVQAGEMLALDALLHLRQSGVAVARVKGKDFVPEADLALSLLLKAQVFPCVALDLPTARWYLARESLNLPQAEKGYVLLTYQDCSLGFGKNLGTRMNNLYPQARRIKMQY